MCNFGQTDRLASFTMALGWHPRRLATMPFSNHYVPLYMEAMRSAYYTVCDALLLKGDVDDPMTEIIVNKIVDLVMAGASNDADRSAELVLLDLADDGPRPSASVHVDREMRSDLLIPMR
jgi:hypothetical protein